MLTQINYPVTGTKGNYQNVFPSNQPLMFELLRRDASISRITSGTNERVRITSSSNFEGLSVGNQITWETKGYSNRSSRVTLVAGNEIEVDEPFTSTDARAGFVNYHKNYFVELRFVVANTETNSQTAILVLDDLSRVPNDRQGRVFADLTAPRDLLNPELKLTTDVEADLSLAFKVQYRASYQGNRNSTWLSPANDVPIMLVMASRKLTVGYGDLSITKRFIRGYPLFYSFIHSSVNDEGNNDVKINVQELSISGEEIKSYQLASFLNLNGVASLTLDTNNFDKDTCFVNFSSEIVENPLQYDPRQYDPTQYG